MLLGRHIHSYIKGYKLKKAGLIISLFALVGLAACGGSGANNQSANASASRTRLSVVGSSTVFPFASSVAEQLAAATGIETPKIEANGTGGGFAIFCSGNDLSTPDVANASRKIKKSEFETCQKNGVNGIIEIKVGYDGIIIATSKTGADFSLTAKQLYLALAKTIPQNGQMVANPYKNWHEIDPSLPNKPIDVMGPPPTSGTRDAFVELIMEHGAKEFPELKEMSSKDSEGFKQIATSIREDGAWKDMGENDNLIVQALERNPNQIGIFGYSFYEENKDRIKAAQIDGKLPNVEDISSGAYSASRSLYIYVKQSHIALLKDLQSFMNEFVSEKAAGPRGYLVSKGLIPLSETERAAQVEIVTKNTIIQAPQ